MLKRGDYMPVKPYWRQVEPAKDAVLWRFLDLRKFRDLMASEELYFRRADLFTDKTEGLPPEAYAQRVLGLDPYDINDRVKLNNHLGHLAQNREAYFISCWYLFDLGNETLDMWETYGHDGVAVCSRYDLLHSTLNGLLDDAFLGRIQYGTDHLTDRFNALEFITTKQLKYKPDCEVRALIASYDLLDSGNRHIDLNNHPHPRPLPINPRNSWVPDAKRRRIDLRKLITDVVISPWAEPDAVEEITLWVALKGFPAAARKSALTGGDTPTLAEFREHRHLFSPRPEELEVTEETDASKDEIERFTEEIARLPVERVRWLYKKRWDVLRLYPGDIPRLSDAQYLESTLRILDTWKKRKINLG
jgi:hypothetical protein